MEGKLKLYNFFSTFVPILFRISVFLTNYLFINPATSIPKNCFEILFLFGLEDSLIYDLFFFAGFITSNAFYTFSSWCATFPTFISTW